jgi:hypothetical protein
LPRHAQRLRERDERARRRRFAATEPKVHGWNIMLAGFASLVSIIPPPAHPP